MWTVEYSQVYYDSIAEISRVKHYIKRLEEEIRDDNYLKPILYCEHRIEVARKSCSPFIRVCCSFCDFSTDSSCDNITSSIKNRDFDALSAEVFCFWLGFWIFSPTQNVTNEQCDQQIMYIVCLTHRAIEQLQLHNKVENVFYFKMSCHALGARDKGKVRDVNR